jgi:hypothetical protein
MRICGQEFSPAILQHIQQAVHEEPALSRGALSRRVCEWLNWRTVLGKLKEVSCRVALLKLHRRALIELPPARPSPLPPPRQVEAASVKLEPHYQATGQRLAGEKVVLAVQDATSLNYSTHPATEGLGPIGSKVRGPLGLWLHSTLAFNLEGTPLGLLDVQCWARDGASFGKKHQRK